MKLKDDYDISNEYTDLFNDIIKFATILLVLNLLMFLSNPSQNTLFGETYTQFMIYILLGVGTYWLVISKLVKFD